MCALGALIACNAPAIAADTAVVIDTNADIGGLFSAARDARAPALRGADGAFRFDNHMTRI